MTRRSLAAIAAVPVVLALAACSGSGSTSGSGAGAAASAAVEATAAASPGATCDKAGFVTAMAPAMGSVETYVWKPFTGGALKAGAKGRDAALKTAASATALVAGRFDSAKALIAGCPDSIIVVNALTTGSSLAKAANGQLVKGDVNSETLAGVNSIVGTVTAQAAKFGVTLKASVPTAAELAAAKIG